MISKDVCMGIFYGFLQNIIRNCAVLLLYTIRLLSTTLDDVFSLQPDNRDTGGHHPTPQ